MIALKQGGRTLLELLSELSELLLQIREFLLQVCDAAAICGDFFFKMRNPFPICGSRSCACSWF